MTCRWSRNHILRAAQPVNRSLADPSGERGVTSPDGDAVAPASVEQTDMPAPFSFPDASMPSEAKPTAGALVASADFLSAGASL